MATRLRPSFSIPDFFKEILIILLQNCDVVLHISAGPLFIFYPVRSVVPEGVERDGGFLSAKTTELQYGFSMKCPSCPYNLSTEWGNVNTASRVLHPA
ncbi:hypothetical protein LNP74_11395 [Klebsiella pneumoniae subsp. pneumoniae]|nr:hypothetical protein [Klebsiella pneumoniae subsp. pneumoniae]